MKHGDFQDFRGVFEAMMIWCSNQGPTTVALLPFNAFLGGVVKGITLW